MCIVVEIFFTFFVYLHKKCLQLCKANVMVILEGKQMNITKVKQQLKTGHRDGASNLIAGIIEAEGKLRDTANVDNFHETAAFTKAEKTWNTWVKLYVKEFAQLGATVAYDGYNTAIVDPRGADVNISLADVLA